MDDPWHRVGDAALRVGDKGVSRTERHPLNLIVAIIVVSLGGCANLQLPAIDPSGERVFLPTPNYTTLAPHDSESRVRTPSLAPVFQAPDPPQCQLPPTLPNQQSNPLVRTEPRDDVAPRTLLPGLCQQRTDIYAVHPKKEAGDNESTVTLTPRREIAPVGTEVYFIGGVCDANGFYRTREKLEWAIAQGSVGHFVEPGKPAVGYFRLRGQFAAHRAGPQPQLLSNNYAITQTTRKPQVLTRGTPKPSDDLFVLQGQSWISVTSPVEGDTYVTLMAPKLDGWQQRQAMAVIHWVDGQWTLPPPVISKTVEPVTLNTTVTRRLSSNAVAGWIVRYEIVGDSPAAFEGGAREVEVMTDALGSAAVQVVPTDPQGGTAQIRVRVIRPAGTGGRSDRLIVGEGVTTVAWSTATLAIEVSGPSSVELNGTADYQITVSNPSQLVADQAVVSAMIPTGFEYISSDPAASLFGRRLDWNLGTIGAGEQRTLTVTYRAVESGVARHCATARLGQSPPVEHCVTTLVTADALFVEMVGPNPELPVEVGQMVQYQVTITNRGNEALDDVLLIDRFDEGLKHEQGASPIEWPLGRFEAGESRKVGLTFEVAAAGRHCHTLEATASGTKPAQVSACVIAQEPPRLSLAVRKTGPAEARVGDRIDFFTVIENTGEGPLTNLQVSDVYDPEFRPIFVDPPAANSEQDRVVWYFSRLEPGEKQTLRVTCDALFNVPLACSRVTVRAAGGVEQTDELCVPVIPEVNAEPNVPPDAGPIPPTQGAVPGANTSSSTLPPADQDAPATGLTISIDDRAERLRVGEELRYLVLITNRRQMPDSNVVLTVKLSPNVSLQSYDGPVSAETKSPDWRLLTMYPIRTLRAGETVQFTVLVKVDRPGDIVSRVELTSLRTPDPIVDEEQALAVP